MGLFENFPWTNMHNLNLDWILQEVKKLKEAGGYSPENPPPYPVTSVNGQTGAVVLFNEQEGVYVRFPDSDNPQWNIYRLVNGVPAGIQFSATLPAKRMQGENQYEIYDQGNPPPYPVTMVNGKTGAVVLFEDQDGAYIKFPNTDNPQWNVYRIIEGQVNGIQFHKNGRAIRMQGDNRYEIYDQGNPPPYPVTSVNGLTGAAETPFTDHTDDILEFVSGAVGATWGLKRKINTGTANEAEVALTMQVNDTTGNPEAYIETSETVKKLLTEDDIPSDSGVVSINGKTGVVSLTGANTPIEPNNQQTVAQAITAEAQARAQADSSLSDNIANLREGVAIVVDGDSAAIAVPVGGYAWIRNNTHGLSDGIYKNTSSSVFPVSGGTADSTVFTAVSTGAVNDILAILMNNLTVQRRTDYTATNWNGTPSVLIYKVGNIVFGFISGNAQTAAAGTPLITLPADLHTSAPSALFFPVYRNYGGNGIIGEFRIDSSGIISINNNQNMETANNVNCFFVYPL